MVLHTTPYPSACLHFLDGLSWSLVFPCYWLLDRLLAACVATSLEKHRRSQDPCSFLSLCVVVSVPLYLLFFLLSLPFGLLGFLLWAPLQAVRQPYLYTYSRSVGQPYRYTYSRSVGQPYHYTYSVSVGQPYCYMYSRSVGQPYRYM